MKRRRQKSVPEESGRAAAGAVSASEPRYRVREGHVIVVDDVTSARMRGVRQRGTRPELLVRRSLASLGQRYRLNNRDLPGSPDIANRTKRWAVFVHGCFWHRHGCKATTTPTRNRAFWEAKFARNIARDERIARELGALGYSVIIIWECQTKAGEAIVREALESQLPR